MQKHQNSYQSMQDEKKYSLEEKRFTSFLQSRRLRKTPERFEILRCCEEYEGHFDADILYNLLETKGYHVSKATIYNTLELLSDAGIIRKLLFDTHQARYERAEATHSHLVCTLCGEITEVELADFELNQQMLQSRGFRPAYISTCIYGICAKCQQQIDRDSDISDKE